MIDLVYLLVSRDRQLEQGQEGSRNRKTKLLPLVTIVSTDSDQQRVPNVRFQRSSFNF